MKSKRLANGLFVVTSFGNETTEGVSLSAQMEHFRRPYRSAFRYTLDYKAREGSYTGAVRAHIYRGAIVGGGLTKRSHDPEDMELIAYLETYPDWPGRQDIESETIGHGSRVKIPGVRLREHHGNTSDMPPYVVLLQQRAWKRGTRGYGEIHWPEGGKDGVCGYENIDPAESLMHLRGTQQALQFLGRITPRPGGSPEGPRKGRVWSRRECLAWWVSWTELDGPPTQKKLSVDMSLSAKDPTAAISRWRATGLQWPPTEEELEELDDE